MTNPLIVRISCQTEKEKWDKFRSHKFDLPQIIVCGDNTIDDFYKLDGDVLYLKCGDLWEHLPEKMIFLCHALSTKDFEQYTHFIKCDADIEPSSSFNKEKFINSIKGHDYAGARTHLPKYGKGIYHLKKNLSDDCYWKRKSYIEPDFFKATYALGGFGYILSKKSVEIISNYINLTQTQLIRKRYIYEDSMIGIILKKYKITPRKINLYLIDTDKYKKGTTRRPRSARRRSLSQVRVSRHQN